VRIGRVTVDQADEQLHFEVQVMLGGLSPECVQVQLYADPDGDGPPMCVPMRRAGSMHGVVNGHLYRAAVPAQRPAEHFTARIVPRHPDAILPMESARIAWQR
jgi:starch phosphorylase